MPLPLACFFTWSTYGSRLHGDDRGSVGPMHNRRGSAFIPSDPELEAAQRLAMSAPTFVLTTPQQRTVVEHAIRDHCDVRGWSLKALNVRTTHVHIVLDCRGMHTPEQAMSQLKSWATRRLRSGGLTSPEARLWTDHGSTRWINTEESFVEAVDYVLNRQ